DTRRVMLVTDDLNPMDALKSHLNSLLRMVVELGYDPMDAIRMVTLNPATYYHLDDEIGGIAPGLKANMVVLRDLESFNVMLTISNGRIVAKDGRIVITIDKWRYPDKAYKTINVKRMPSTDDFKFKVNVDFGSALVHVIGVEDKSLYTKHITSKLAVQNGSIIPNPKEDILQIAVIERHKSSGNISLGFVKGFGLNSGALASTIAHDSHNIVVVGVDWSDMAYAVKGIVDMGGGIIVVKNSRVLGVLPLPIAGLMSSEDAYSVSSKVELLYDNVRKLGCKLREPFMTLSFIALPVIPEIKLTDKGLVWHNPETKKLEFISPIIGLSNFDLP
ncbi:MAG: adenine deaminase C-terminal domain-containing protein, partial [Candidatus Methanomethylicia archaeon]